MTKEQPIDLMLAVKLACAEKQRDEARKLCRRQNEAMLVHHLQGACPDCDDVIADFDRISRGWPK